MNPNRYVRPIIPALFSVVAALTAPIEVAAKCIGCPTRPLLFKSSKSAKMRAQVVARQGGMFESSTVIGEEALHPNVRVRLFDYARISKLTLTMAKADASALLKRSGVTLEWAECSLHERDAPKDPACGLPTTPLDLQMHILDHGMAKRARTTHRSLGYAIVADGFDSIAAVFMHRAVDLESRNLATRSAILGALMAHEIAHLLLEQADHSRTGILRASWGDEDLKNIAKGWMGFTAEQARRMVSMVARRSEETAGYRPVGAGTHESASAHP